MSEDGIILSSSVNIPMEEFVFQQVEIYKNETSCYNILDYDIEYDEEWIFHVHEDYINTGKETNIRTRKTDVYYGMDNSFSTQYRMYNLEHG